MWKCGECQHELIEYSVQPQADDEGCYFVCPQCGGWNPLINMSASMANEFESTWLAQPSMLDPHPNDRKDS